MLKWCTTHIFSVCSALIFIINTTTQQKTQPTGQKIQINSLISFLLEVNKDKDGCGDDNDKEWEKRKHQDVILLVLFSISFLILSGNQSGFMTAFNGKVMSKAGNMQENLNGTTGCQKEYLKSFFGCCTPSLRRRQLFQVAEPVDWVKSSGLKWQRHYDISSWYGRATLSWHVVMDLVNHVCL